VSVEWAEAENPVRDFSSVHMQPKRHHAVDWPGEMVMDEEMFAEYARQLEREDFEASVVGVVSSVRQLVHARRETISRLRSSAAYLDSVWMRCRLSRTMGTSASVLGGGLTIAGGILTTITAGAAAPVLIAGIATSSVGTAANIGASIIEKILNSRQIKEMNSAFERDKDITLKLEEQIEDIKNYNTSLHLHTLLIFASQLLGKDHLVTTLLKGILVTKDDDFNSGEIIESVEVVENTEYDSKKKADPPPCNPASSSLNLLNNHKDGVRFNPLDAGVLVEGGKVIGQNSFKMAGQVIIGISAAFMLWDAIDLGFTISDLVRKQGSRAGRVLREKADTLEAALKSTVCVYSIDMPE